MSEAVDSGVNVIDIFELSIDDNASIDTSVTAPLPPDRRNSRRSIPLITFNAEDKYHEDYNSETDGVTKLKHNMYNDIQEKVQSLHTTENLVTMIKVRSVLVLIGIIFSVILLFQIPIILYYTDPPTYDLFTIPEVDVKACSGDPVEPSTEELLNNCNITNVTDIRQDCINSSAITGLHTVYALGMTFNERHCTMDALPFFCDATLHLCGENKIFNLTSMCLTVRDSICALEWRAVETFLNTPVPDCTSFEMDRNLTFSKAPLPNCPDQFGIFCDSVCLPVCGEYAPFKRGDSNIYYIFVSIWGTIGLIGGVVTLIACYHNRHKLFHFPQIYIVYNTVVMEVYLLLFVLPVILRAAGESKLVCSDHSFLLDLREPTNFCQTQGFLLQFTFFCFLGFWCFHLFHLFLGLAFPYKAKQWMDSRKTRAKFHITEVVIVLVCGIVPPILTIRLSNYQDNGLLCLPRSTTMIFYGQTLPYIVAFCIGLSLLFYSLWILRKKHHLKSRNVAVSKIFCLHCTTSETKLYILFFYYGVAMLFFIYTLVTLLRSIDAYNMYSLDYIICSAGGFKGECEMYRENAEGSFTVTFVLSIFICVLISFLNLSHLMYVVNIAKLVECIQTKYCK